MNSNSWKLIIPVRLGLRPWARPLLENWSEPAPLLRFLAGDSSSLGAVSSSLRLTVAGGGNGFGTLTWNKIFPPLRLFLFKCVDFSSKIYSLKLETKMMEIYFFNILDRKELKTWKSKATLYIVAKLLNYLRRVQKNREQLITVGRVALALGPTFLDVGPGGAWRLAANWLSFSEKSRSDFTLPSCSGEKLPLSL